METATVTLADFLLARIAEDEQTALQIGEVARWEDRRGEVFAVAGMSWRRVAEVDEANGVSTIAAEHIARHDPARVLAECEAKRRIVTQVQTLVGAAQRLAVDAARRGDTRPIDEKAIEVHAAYILPLLALPYADHSDYRDEWRL